MSSRIVWPGGFEELGILKSPGKTCWGVVYKIRNVASLRIDQLKQEMYRHTHLCAYVCMYILMCVYTQLCVYAQTHTHRVVYAVQN